MSDPSGTPSDRPARILVVDDEPLNVDYLEQELECHGFVTDTAGNGLEALERIAADPPDLVLLDVMMPELDGISALRILKSDPETRLIPVVLMTALNAVEDRVRGIEAGADDFLSKPVDERELLARINTALALKRTIDEAVGELRSTSAHLERHGRRQLEVAILVVEWQLTDPALPTETVSFLGRHERDAAEEHIAALGGTLSEDETSASSLVAVFDGPDPRARALAAVEAGLAVLAGNAGDPAGTRKLIVGAAIAAGSATVGSTRVADDGSHRWVYAALGEPVDRARRLARAAVEGELVASASAAAVVSDVFELVPVGDAFRVLPSALSGAVEDDGSPPSDRRIRTILTMDVVGSTVIVERVGDRAWSELIAAHERGIRSELVRFGGEELDTAGDGFIAAFDSPARAIRCGLAVIGRATSLELTIRAGIHTGEVEHVDGRARGITLHLSSRIAGEADSGELLVSATTRELAAGSGLGFVDRGEYTLKGVQEARRLFAASDAGSSRPVAQASGEDPDAAGPSAYPAGLTAREVDVLRLVAIGLSDAEAAQRLFLSVRTVNAHLRSIYRKLGIHSRAAAGRFALENGLV